MTAPPISTAMSALRRADHSWCRSTADEPLDRARLDHLAGAVQDRLESWTAAPADEVAELREEVDRVRAFEEQRREDLRVELWKHIDVQQRRADRAEQERDALGPEVTRQERRAVRAERERDDLRAHVARLAEQPDDLDVTEAHREADRLRIECDTLASRLHEVAGERDAAQANVDRLTGLLEEAAATAAPAAHRHAWEWQPRLKPLPFPCSCGEPWPRNRTPGGD